MFCAETLAGDSTLASNVGFVASMYTSQRSLRKKWYATSVAAEKSRFSRWSETRWDDSLSLCRSHFSTRDSVPVG